MHQPTRRPVPEWLEPLTEMRRQGRMPKWRYVTVALGIPKAIGRTINIPNAYNPEAGDDFRAVAGLDVELFFSRDTGFHRLRIICEGCIEADVRRLVLLPDTHDARADGEYPTSFILLKRGGL